MNTADRIGVWCLLGIGVAGFAVIEHCHHRLLKQIDEDHNARMAAIDAKFERDMQRINGLRGDLSKVMAERKQGLKQ